MSRAGPSIENEKPAGTGNADIGPEVKPPWRKIVALGAVLSGLLLVVYFSPLRHYLEQVRQVSSDLRTMGFWAPWVMVVGVSLLVAVGFPRLLFCLIAGMALGFWPGLLWVQLGTLIGNYIQFLVVRAGGMDWGKRYLSRHGGFSLTDSEGIVAVIMARQLPVPGLIINLALGMTHLKHRHFLLGTVVGQLPEAIPVTLMGAGAIQSSLAKSVGTVGLAVLVLGVMWMGFRYYLRRRRS